jgi:hypothetical protein
LISSQIVSELIFGGLRSPLTVAFRDSKEYLSTTKNDAHRNNNLKRLVPEKKAMIKDKDIINSIG